MVMSTLCITDTRSVEAATASTTMYFYNADDWAQVGAYVYGAQGDFGENGEALGGFTNTLAVVAPEIGEKWYKVDVPATPAFSIIFYNKSNDQQRAELWIPDASHVYVSSDGSAHTSSSEAELPATKVYFLNNRGWESVYAYAYDTNENQLLGGWPGKAATSSVDLGGDWYETEVPAKAGFTVIFNDGVGDEGVAGAGKQYSFEINDKENIYTSTDGVTSNTVSTKAAAESAVGIESQTIVYFLNSKNWEQVGAYAYGQGEPLGGWPGRTPVSAEEELGDGWLKISVPVSPKFNIIFFNATEGGDPDKERTELQIPDQNMVYVTGSKEVYSSKTAAEIAEGKGDLSEMSVAYFYNSRNWKKVNGYTFTKEAGKADDPDADGITLGAGWPGKEAASAAEEVGDNWWKLTIPQVATQESPVFVIFNDGVNQTKDIKLTSQNGNYIIPTSDLFASKEDAEEAAESAVYEDDFGDAVNEDLAGYTVTYGGAGAALPFTAYEAEAANTNAEVLTKETTYSDLIQSEASGRQAVKLQRTSDYVEFILTEAANAMVLRYCIPDSNDGTGIDAGLNVYVDGEQDSTLDLTSGYEWVYGSYPYSNTPSQGRPHRFFDEVRLLFGKTLPAGTRLKLQKDSDNTAEYYIVDLVECEVAMSPLTQPEGSLSVTDSEFGAIANDNEDDYDAFVKCIQKATETGKEVWIPAGTFDLKARKALEVSNVTLRGAGMWYSNLVGEGAAFKFSGTCKFYDFAMTGMATVRRDSEDLAGFEPTNLAYNSTIQNIWMEHMKVGVWSANTKNLVIQGCRIRNTYADGINLCSLTNGATVRNNHLRNTGDDCIAIWPWLGDCADNIITHNTVQLPNLANGIAIYGGENNTIAYNYVADIINNGSGICVGSDYDIANGYNGTTTVNGNVLARCGSYQTDHQYPVGAIWVWSTKNPMAATFDIKNNTLYDCTYEAFLIDGYNAVSGVSFTNNQVDGATDGILLRGNGSSGAAIVEDIAIANRSGELVVDNSNGAVQLTYRGKGIYQVDQIEEPVEENQHSNEQNEQANEQNQEGNEQNEQTNEQNQESNEQNQKGNNQDQDVRKQEEQKQDDKNQTKDQNGGKNSQNPEQDIKVQKINLTGISKKIAAGKKIQLTASVTPKNATNKELTWRSSNKKYATVDQKGRVKVKKSGAGKSVTITATATDGSGVVASYKIKIMKKAVTKIKLKSDNSVKAGKSLKIKATVTAKKGANKKLIWTSSNTRYATVTKKGVVKAKRAGKGKKVTIKAQATDGSNRKASIRISIR